MTVTHLVGDVFDRLRDIPDQHFDCVVTSPPYWGLRDYGVAGQIGMEPTLGEHLAVMVNVFREIRRVLKRHGTCWVNYGDCYATTPNGRAAAAVENDDRTFRDKPFSTIGPIYQPNHSSPRGEVSRSAAEIEGGYRRGNYQDHGGRIVAGGFLKPKDLAMIPNRLAIALQDDGWWVRSEIIWNKTNPKPESIADRPAAVHEKIWLLTKSESYFFNAEALREPVTGGAKPRRKDGQCKPAKGTAAPGHSRAGTWVETYVPETRNGRNVWTFNIEGCREAHFATFPRELARRCIAAGTPPSACAACGAIDGCGPLCAVFGRVPGRVLDPFGGSGTVGLVAESLGLDATLIELNPAYVEIARNRLDGAPKAASMEVARRIVARAPRAERGRARPPVKWAEEVTRRFIGLWDAGVQISVIGAKLGVSKAGLLAKRAELGLPPRRDGGDPRNRALKVYLNQDESASIANQATRQSVSAGEYVRGLVRKDLGEFGLSALFREAAE